MLTGAALSHRKVPILHGFILKGLFVPCPFPPFPEKENLPLRNPAATCYCGRSLPDISMLYVTVYHGKTL